MKDFKQKMKDRRAYKGLCADVNYYNQAYHIDGNSPISDNEFDSIMMDLLDMEKKYPQWVTPDSPSQELWLMFHDEMELKRHPTALNNLDTVFSYDSLRKWYTRFDGQGDDIVVQHKLVGISVNLVYVNGHFLEAITGGTGRVGIVVTDILKDTGIPLVIRHKGLTEMRGELVINKAMFNCINTIRSMNGHMTFTDPVSLLNEIISGDEGVEADYELLFYAHGIVSNSLIPSSEINKMWLLRKLGFMCVETELMTMEGIGNLYQSMCDWSTGKRKRVPHDIDGLVIKANMLGLKMDLGYAKRFPRWSVALKFPEREVTSTVTSINSTVDQSGEVVPLLSIEPVDCGGEVLTSVAVDNFSELHEMDVQLGSELTLSNKEGGGTVAVRACVLPASLEMSPRQQLAGTSVAILGYPSSLTMKDVVEIILSNGGSIESEITCKVAMVVLLTDVCTDDVKRASDLNTEFITEADLYKIC